MGDKAEYPDGPQQGSSGYDRGAVNDPLTQTDVKASPAGCNCRNPE